MLLGVAGCTGGGLLRSAPPSPHEQYRDMLRRAGLDQTALGQAWTAASDHALAAPVNAASPFRESGYFAPGEARAVGYRLELRRGRRLSVTVSFESSEPARLFVDLFELQAGAAPRRVVALEPQASELTYEVDRDGGYVLRLQPELLRGGRFTLTERTASTLLFPVPGLTARAVQSLFGAQRDAGAREHEGVDIFASRGTPVVAVTSGMARTSTNTLGGNVVWLHGASGGPRYYYAHLDRWAINGVSLVTAGDVLGYVGNTGNARTTSPHLHFGVYDGAAIDPLPFLQPDDPVPPEPAATRMATLGELVRVQAVRTPMLTGAAANASPAGELTRGAVARVYGVSQTKLRLILPDGASGYVDAAATTPAAAPVRRERLRADAVLREQPVPIAPVVEVLASGTAVEVLGQFGVYELLQIPDGISGWVEKLR